MDKLNELDYYLKSLKFRNAKFPKVKTIDDYDFTAMENMDKRKIMIDNLFFICGVKLQ